VSVKRWQDDRGKKAWYVSKVWPDGRRFRRKMPSKREAAKINTKIEASIIDGSWSDLRVTLGGPDRWDPTIEEFSEVYLEEYCRARNRRPEFKRDALRVINRIVGQIRVSSFTRSDAYTFMGIRGREVQPATVNRGMAVLKNMLSYAVEKGLIKTHPLTKFRALPEKPKSLKLMTLEEERRLVGCVRVEDLVIGSYVAILGETGMRKTEGLNLKWSNVDLVNRIVSLELTKSGKVRNVPLSRFATEAFLSVPRASWCPWVFYSSWTRTRWIDPRGPFEKGKKKAKLSWVGFHDLRHFRASQWVMKGMDLRTVQELLGHSSLAMTQRYAHLAPAHATDHVDRIAALEEANLQKVTRTWTESGRR